MRDWIVGLQKAAIEHRAGVSPEAWTRTEADAGYEAPEELRDLYAALNGASFASGVVLYPVGGAGDHKGMIEQNASGIAGLPTSDVWRFGRKDQEHLAAVRKRRVSEIDQADGAAPPDWLEEAGDDAWIYVARDESTNGLRIYRTLELLLAPRVPPAEAEEFGERTYARALRLVEDAISDLNHSAKKQVERISAAVKSSVKKIKKVKKVKKAKRAPIAKAKAKAKPKAKPAATKAKRSLAKKRAKPTKRPAAKRAAPKKKSGRKTSKR